MSFLSSILGLSSLFKGDSSPYLKQQQALANKQMEISDALVNPNNAMYQNLFNQKKQAGAQDMAATIAEAQRQNRVNSRLGRTPLLDQERGGENFFRALMKGYNDLGVQADEQTRASLRQGLGGAYDAQQSFNKLTPYKTNVKSQKLAGYQGLADILENSLPAIRGL